MRFTFGKKKRITRGAEITLAIRKGSCVADGTLVVFAIESKRESANQGISRLGVTVAKKTGNAVARNHWKRLIRESFRTQQNQIPAGYDFVIRPKKDAQPSWASIQKSVPRLTTKAVARIRT